MSDGLLAFLRARADEREALAKAAAERSTAEWHQSGDHPEFSSGWVIDANDQPVVYDEGSPSREEALHIAAHDPAWALRDVAADRAILAAYAEALRIQDGYKEVSPETANREALELVCRHRAAVYSTHPDYRKEWAPA